MPLKKPVFLIAPRRTPIGKFGGALRSLSAPDLGSAAVRAVLQAARLEPEAVDELLFGNARQAGVGPNPARQIAQRSGMPHTVPAHTLNKACGSGLEAIVSAARLIQLEEASLVVAGGTESMSNTPYLLPQARWGQRLGHSEVVDGMYRDGFLCPLCGMLMGETAEKLADRYQISRREQDEFAVLSQHRAEEARHQGRFEAEIVPVQVPGRRGESIQVSRDEHPRDNVTLESLARLRPVFRAEGTVHAGNASGITDGAAALLVADGERRSQIEGAPVCRLLGYASAGVDPSIMGVGPVPAVRALLEKTGVALSQIDLIELNEAFASQVLACVRELELDLERVNVNGGAIALGHPIGCTGARIVVTLMHEMQRRRARLGLATLCISGGMGMAVLLENALLS